MASNYNKIKPEVHPVVVEALSWIMRCRATGDVEGAYQALRDAALIIGGIFNKKDILDHTETFYKETENYLSTRNKQANYADQDAYIKDHALRLYKHNRNTEFLSWFMLALNKYQIAIVGNTVPTGREIGY